MRRSKRLKDQRAPVSLNVPAIASRKLAKNVFNQRRTNQLRNGNTSKSAVHVFPEEVWIIIFHLVKDPLDRYHAMHACPSFRQILIPKMTTWMFPASIYNIYCYLPIRDALKCRQVCKTWRNGFDSMVENTLCPKAVDGHSTVLEEVIRRQFGSHFPARFSMKPDAHQVRNSWMQRLPAIKEHPSNPIIGRSVVFYHEERHIFQEENPAAFWRNALRVVKKIGGHLSHIEFIDKIYFRSENTEEQYYLILHECLTFVPNLKSLTFTRASGLESFDNDDESKELLRQNPLPNLQHLNALILLCEDIPSFIKNQLIIQYAPQLQHIKCYWNDEFDDIANLTKAQRLEEFSIFEVPHSKKTLFILNNFLQTPHLKKLQIWLDESDDGYGPYGSTDEDRGWKMNEFLQLLAKFPQLALVDVHYRNDFIWKNCFSKHLTLARPGTGHVPSLKVLKIVEIQGIVYDFLEYLPNLEKLYVKKVEINCYGHRVDDPKAKVRLTEHLYLNTIQESNVWCILKKLQLVQFRKVKLIKGEDYLTRQEQVISEIKCTRKDFEAFLHLKKF